jgi:hypothetical protein
MIRFGTISTGSSLNLPGRVAERKSGQRVSYLWYTVVSLRFSSQLGYCQAKGNSVQALAAWVLTQVYDYLIEGFGQFQKEQVLNPELKRVPEHMLALGLGALAHANWHSNYMSFENDKWPELSVLQAAHAAEILLKARIAEEHPLLIFEQLPRSTQVTDSFLELKHLFERAKTIQYSELPERLWATTGMKLENLEKYQSFGRLRNSIQHFAPPSETDFSRETVDFIFEVIDPFIHGCWNLYAIDYNEDSEPYIYLIESLIRKGVKFLVSPNSVEDLKHVDFEWPKDNLAYEREMKRRFAHMGFGG